MDRQDLQNHLPVLNCAHFPREDILATEFMNSKKKKKKKVILATFTFNLNMTS